MRNMIRLHQHLLVLSSLLGIWQSSAEDFFLLLLNCRFRIDCRKSILFDFCGVDYKSFHTLNQELIRVRVALFYVKCTRFCKFLVQNFPTGTSALNLCGLCSVWVLFRRLVLINVDAQFGSGRVTPQTAVSWTRAALGAIRIHMCATRELDLAGCFIVDDDVAEILSSLRCLERLILDNCQKL